MVQNPQPFLSTNLEHPHHRKAIWAVVAAILVLGAFLLMYFLKNQPMEVQTVVPVVEDPMAKRRAILSQPNPTANLTTSEVAVRKKVLDSPNPPSKLTPEQIKSRQTALNNI